MGGTKPTSAVPTHTNMLISIAVKTYHTKSSNKRDPPQVVKTRATKPLKDAVLISVGGTKPSSAVPTHMNMSIAFAVKTLCMGRMKQPSAILVLANQTYTLIKIDTLCLGNLLLKIGAVLVTPVAKTG